MFLKKKIPKEKEKHVKEEQPLLAEDKNCLENGEQPWRVKSLLSRDKEEEYPEEEQACSLGRARFPRGTRAYYRERRTLL
jgi:hypothetical protein